jgi:hypothetical protein
MPAVELFGAPKQDAEHRPASTARLINVFREGAERGAVLRQAPGMTRFLRLDGMFCRALRPIGDALIAAHGGRLWRVDEGGAARELTDIADDAETTVAGLNGRILAVAAGAFTVYEDNDGTDTPAPGAFSRYGSLAVMAQRVVLAERDGRRLQWSDVDDPKTLDGLNFATAEQRDDRIVRIMAVGGDLWVFKETCIEQWYATGGADADAFAFRTGSLVPVGLRAFGLVTETPTGAFFVATDGRAYLGAPGALRPVSTVPVETALAEGTPWRCFHTRFEGHEFCVIRFRDRPAWCLDVATGEWWERAQGDDLGPWEAVAAAAPWGRPLVGCDDGRLLWLDASPTDDNDPIHRRMVSRTIDNGGRRFRVPRLELPCHVGRGAVDDYAAQPEGGVQATSAGVVQATTLDGLLAVDAAEKRTAQVLMRVSRDRGQTWGQWVSRSLGDVGRYETRVVWRALGQFETLAVEVACAEPLDITFDCSAWVEVA